MSLGENIKKARVSKGWTQSQLADALSSKDEHYGNTTISNWENDINKPDAEIIKKICILLNVDANYLFDFDSVKKEYEKKNNPILDKYAMLFDKMGDLSEEDQKIVLNVTESIINEIDNKLDNNND